MNLSITFDPKDFLTQLNKLEGEVGGKITKALREMAQELKKESDQQIPKKYRELVGTGEIKVKKGESSVSYDTVYAAYQHEGGDGSRVIKNYTTPGTKKKYLEDPLKQNLSKWNKILADNLQ
jgi:hypothetical protein